MMQISGVEFHTFVAVLESAVAREGLCVEDLALVRAALQQKGATLNLPERS